MIKINLLPRTINEKKIVKNTAMFFGVLVIAIIVAGVVYTKMCLVPKTQAMDQQAVAAETLQQQVEGIEKERDDWKGKLPPIKQKLDFIKNVNDYNTKYPALYEEVAKWTYDKVSYLSMVSDGTQMSMQARAKNLDDLGRFLLNMYRATDLFTEVTISGVPGYKADQGGGGMPMQMQMAGGAPPMAPPGIGDVPQANLAGMGAINVSTVRSMGPKYIDFTVSCKLKTPITAPTFTAAAAPAAGGAAGATPGAPAAPAPAGP